MADFSCDLKAALLATSEVFEALVRRAVCDAVSSLREYGDPDALVDAVEAARLLGMSAAALRRANERGRFPVKSVRLGRRLRWRRGDLAQFLHTERTEKASSLARAKPSSARRRTRQPKDSPQTTDPRGVDEPLANGSSSQEGLT